MATVDYSTSANFGSKVALAVGMVKEAVAILARAKEAASATAYGADASPTWSRIEGGDYGVGAGKGQAWYDAVNGLHAALTDSNAIAFGNQLDKGA